VDATSEFDYNKWKRKEVYLMTIIYRLVGLVYIIFLLAAIAFGIYFVLLVVKALRRYIQSKEVREEKKEVRKSLAEILKENRTRCKMTQEFVSETIGVSRQAVSKWENGSADPSTSNLIALANLYKVSAEELLKGATQKRISTDISKSEKESEND